MSGKPSWEGPGARAGVAGRRLSSSVGSVADGLWRRNGPPRTSHRGISKSALMGPVCFLAQPFLFFSHVPSGLPDEVISVHRIRTVSSSSHISSWPPIAALGHTWVLCVPLMLSIRTGPAKPYLFLGTPCRRFLLLSFLSHSSLWCIFFFFFFYFRNQTLGLTDYL